ncbi:MAG: 50S ribosomal protein L18 [Bacteroidota bacterium]
MQTHKEVRRGKIRQRIRKVVKGTAERPRLSVFRSNKQIYAQIIDDINGVTVAAVSSRPAGNAKINKLEQAASVGKMIGEKAISVGLTQVVFDRGGYLYHGRVKALADGAREAGLKF